MTDLGGRVGSLTWVAEIIQPKQDKGCLKMVQKRKQIPNQSRWKTLNREVKARAGETECTGTVQAEGSSALEQEPRAKSRAESRIHFLGEGEALEVPVILDCNKGDSALLPLVGLWKGQGWRAQSLSFPVWASAEVQMLPGLHLIAVQHYRRQGSGHGLGSAEPLAGHFGSSHTSWGTF